MSAAGVPPIPNIHVARVYNRRDPECDVHYETFGRLAEFFGRATPVHSHHGFFQVHLLVHGSIRLSLDDQVCVGDAPLLIFTPPMVPHSFYTEPDSDGHVLTIRQEVVRTWFRAMPGQWPDTLLREAAFVQAAELPEPEAHGFGALEQACEWMAREFAGEEKGRTASLEALGSYFFIRLSRILLARQPAKASRAERSQDLRIFLSFCDLVDAHFHEHLTLSEYAQQLLVTEARLNDICRRMDQRPSKEIVHDRLLQEARRLLRFTSVPVSEISYQLGFSDPAYFSRFFTKRAGIAPSQYRLAQP